jgi:hypothetical protein
MNDDKTLDAVDAAEARRAKRRAENEASARAQKAIDLQKIEDIELESGVELSLLEANKRFVPGVPVVVGVRPPSSAEYKRFTSAIRLAKDNAVKRGDAQDQFARACIVYPEVGSDMYKALNEHFPGTLNSVVVVASKLAELATEDEKKG